MACVVQRGTTALQLAAMWGHLDVCRALLAAGADKNKQSNVSFVKWLSPLRRATTRHIGDCRAAEGVQLTSRGLQIGYSPLICGALKGQAEVVRDMVKLGADKDLVDNVRTGVSACRRMASFLPTDQPHMNLHAPVRHWVSSCHRPCLRRRTNGRPCITLQLEVMWLSSVLCSRLARLAARRMRCVHRAVPTGLTVATV